MKGNSEEFSNIFEDVLDNDFDQSFEDQTNRINEELNQEVLIALVGDVNSGKSSTINRLMQKEVAFVGSKPGQTVETQEYKYTEKIIFVDTPGLDDVNSENSKVTLDYYKKSDIILFFLNAAGTGLSNHELKNLKNISKSNKDIIIVLNKIDAVDDIATLVAYIERETDNEFVIAPVSSKTGENFRMLQIQLLEILKKKDKDLILAKNLKDKGTTANRWILSASVSASAIGASPIPGSDIIPITSIQIGLMVRLASLYDKPLSKENAKELIIATVVGNLGKTAFRQIVKLVPGAGSIAGAGVAGATTLALGYAVKYMYENNMNVNASQLKSIYRKNLKENK